MTEAARNGLIRWDAHVHWARVASHRTSLSGRKLVELVAPMSLSLHTKVPSKWACVDLETGEVFAGSDKGLVRASAEFLADHKPIVAMAKNSQRRLPEVVAGADVSRLAAKQTVSHEV